MKQIATHLQTLIPVVLFFLSFEVHAQSWSMTWKDSSEIENKTRVRPVISESDGHQLLFIAFESPLATAKSAGYLAPEVGDQAATEELPVIPVKSKGDKKYLLLWRKAGKVMVSNEDGSSTTFTYELSPMKSELQLSPSCRNLQFKVKTTSQDRTSFPAMVFCKLKDNVVEELTFSTLEEAEWFGSKAFESAGKGERWKTFVYKDISTLGIWEVSWGDPNAKAVGKVLIPKWNKKTPIPPKPTLIFMAGLQYLNGKASRPDKEVDVAGLQIPLSVQYQKDGSWWLLGSGYEFFVYSTTSSTSGSNSLSSLGAWAGTEYKFTKLVLRASIGYMSRALTAPDIGVTSTFEAPRLGIDAHYASGDNLIGLEAIMMQTSGEGKYEELTTTLFYQTKLIFSKETRFQLVNTSLKASTTTLEIEANWLSLGVAVQF